MKRSNRALLVSISEDIIGNEVHLTIALGGRFCVEAPQTAFLPVRLLRMLARGAASTRRLGLSIERAAARDFDGTTTRERRRRVR